MKTTIKNWVLRQLFVRKLAILKHTDFILTFYSVRLISLLNIMQQVHLPLIKA